MPKCFSTDQDPALYLNSGFLHLQFLKIVNMFYRTNTTYLERFGKKSDAGENHFNADPHWSGSKTLVYLQKDFETVENIWYLSKIQVPVLSTVHFKYRYLWRGNFYFLFLSRSACFRQVVGTYTWSLEGSKLFSSKIDLIAQHFRAARGGGEGEAKIYFCIVWKSSSCVWLVSLFSWQGAEGEQRELPEANSAPPGGHRA